MNKRLFIVTVLVMLVIGGMIAGLFMGSIQKSLTLPMMQMLDANNKPAQIRTPVAQVQNKQPSATNPNPNPNRSPTPNMNQNMAANNAANVLAQDTFQRGDQPLWGMSSDGRQWEGDANTAQAFSIANGAGRISNGPNGTLNAVLGTPTQDAEVVAGASVNQFTDGVNFGVVLRWADGNNWYKALLDGTHLNILKRVNGQSTTLTSVHFTAQEGRVYMLRFRAIGAMLFAKAWPMGQTEPNRWLTITSDNSLTNGRVGLRVLVLPTTIISVTSFTAMAATLNNDSAL
jgi:hypothetical protein